MNWKLRSSTHQANWPSFIANAQKARLFSPALAPATSLTGGQADTNKGQGFAIVLALVGALRTFGAPVPLTLGVRPRISQALEALFGHAYQRQTSVQAERAGTLDWAMAAPCQLNEQSNWRHRRAISPSAAGELAGMLTTLTLSPRGLSVLFGSQRIPALRQSATRHRQVGRASCGAQRTGATAPRSASIRQNLWKSIQGGAAMQKPNINIHSRFGVFSSALASVASLTGQSRGHQRAAHVGAPYFGR